MEREALWRSVEDIKYNSLGVGYCSKEVAVPYSLGVDVCFK
jgi:hypothetical protein